MSIHGLTKVKGEYGEFALAQYSTVSNGKREMGKVMIPNSVLENTRIVPPCFLLYKGMRPTKAGRLCHSASSYKPEGLTPDNLDERGDELRRMSFAALDALVSNQTLDSFEPGSVLLVKNASRKRLRKDDDEMLAVEYEAVLGESRSVAHFYYHFVWRVK